MIAPETSYGPQTPESFKEGYIYPIISFAKQRVARIRWSFRARSKKEKLDSNCSSTTCYASQSSSANTSPLRYPYPSFDIDLSNADTGLASSVEVTKKEKLDSNYSGTTCYASQSSSVNTSPLRYPYPSFDIGLSNADTGLASPVEVTKKEKPDSNYSGTTCYASQSSSSNTSSLGYSYPYFRYLSPSFDVDLSNANTELPSPIQVPKKLMKFPTAPKGVYREESPAEEKYSITKGSPVATGSPDIEESPNMEEGPDTEEQPAIEKDSAKEKDYATEKDSATEKDPAMARIPTTEQSFIAEATSPSEERQEADVLQSEGSLQGDEDAPKARSIHSHNWFDMTTAPTSPMTLSRIGTATIKVKMAILPGAYRGDKSFSYLSDSSTESSSSTENNTTAVGLQESDSYQQRSGAQEADGWRAGIRQDRSGSSGSDQPKPRPGKEQEDGEDTGRRRGRKRPKRDEMNIDITTRQRLACPYQVFEPGTLDCFQRGPRNPQGGCEDISRLRQHLARRHMRSRRCGRCWKSFETSDKVSTHLAASTCDERPLPEFERFMDVGDETCTQRSQSPTPEEDAWWTIFQQLIPGMQDRDLFDLKLEYSPYYSSRDTSILIPAINIPNSLFENISSGIPSCQPDTLNTANDESFGLDVNMTSPHPYSFLSQDFSVPVFQASYHSNLSGISGVSRIGSDSNYTISGPSTGKSIVSGHSGQSVSTASSLPLASTQDSASLLGLTSGDIGQTQLERNHLRLKAQYRQAEAENTQLREEKFANRGDLAQAEAVLEDLLSSAGLSQELYESLNQVSELLLGIKRRLVL